MTLEQRMMINIMRENRNKNNGSRKNNSKKNKGDNYNNSYR